MPDLTFLEGKKAFVKTFSPGYTAPYPMLKYVKTHVESVELGDIDQTLEVLLNAASLGYALLKGPTKRHLEWESRQGQSDPQQTTQLLVLDVDGLGLPNVTLQAPFDQSAVRVAAEHVIDQLPNAFKNTSYIAHASSSFGLKGNRISLHLFFWLEQPAHPRAIKPYLTLLNHTCPAFERGIDLSGSGRSLTYVLDPCFADNSRIIYIGHPRFIEGTENPFHEDTHRFVAVRKHRDTLDLSVELAELDAPALDKFVTSKVRNLRSLRGLPATKERTQIFLDGGVRRLVCTNPDNAKLAFYADHGDYVTYNLNGGDSHAYYVRKDDPTLVRNFKGELPFLFQHADPETYAWHIEQFGVSSTDADGKVKKLPIVFRDKASDSHFAGLWNPVEQEFDELHPIQRANIEDFVIASGGIVPEPIPQWDTEFNPQDPRTVDFNAGYLNTYKAPPLIKNPVPLADRFHGLAWQETPEALAELCPNIHKIIFSMLGDGEEELGYFLNWLAYCLQIRDKTGTAWLLHGTQGTGKGAFMHKILRPLMDGRYVQIQRVENIEEQFNNWMETAMFVCVDEFHSDDSVQSQKFVNKLKNYITEPTGTIRLMRQNQKQVRLWANFLFFTNTHDPIRLTAEDRRFNVGRRQETPLKTKYPGQVPDIINALSDELPQFAAFLMAIDVDKHCATTPLENEAKQLLCETSQDSIDLFVRAVQNGDLEYFMGVMETELTSRNSDYLLSAQNHFRSWLRDYADAKSSKVWTVDLRPLYNVLVGRSETDHKFAKLLGHRGITTKSIRRGGVTRKGLEIHWKLTENTLEDLQNRYLGNVEKLEEARNNRASFPV